MLLKSSLLALSVSLMGCGTSAPQMKPIPRCGLIVVEEVAPYFNCQFYDGEDAIGEEWKVQIADLLKKDTQGKPLHPEQYVCTTDEGYADAENFVNKLSRWIVKHCK